MPLGCGYSCRRIWISNDNLDTWLLMVRLELLVVVVAIVFLHFWWNRLLLWQSVISATLFSKITAIFTVILGNSNVVLVNVLQPSMTVSYGVSCTSKRKIFLAPEGVQHNKDNAAPTGRVYCAHVEWLPTMTKSGFVARIISYMSSLSHLVDGRWPIGAAWILPCHLSHSLCRNVLDCLLCDRK